jgi:hypothetical protein
VIKIDFRYDMQGKTSQQQEIVRQKDKREKMKKQEPKIHCGKVERTGDYEAVLIYINNTPRLKLKVSGTAIVNKPCGLKGLDIHDWLCKTGKSIIKDIKEYKVLLITSYDVVDTKLNKKWSHLIETPED